MNVRIRSRLDGTSEQGFTVIELLVVLIIIGLLLAIALPSYLGFRDRAANNAAKENLREALPAARAYHGDHESFTGMDEAKLLAIDSGLSPTLKVVSVTATTYCLADTVNGRTWSVEGPSPTSADFRNNGNCG
jgi:type IV pilus assembly protein PilA